MKHKGSQSQSTVLEKAMGPREAANTSEVNYALLLNETIAKTPKDEQAKCFEVLRSVGCFMGRDACHASR